MIKKILFLLAATFLATSVFAHYVPDNEYAITNTTVLPFVVETKGPVRAPAPTKPSPDLKVSVSGNLSPRATASLSPPPCPP